jgi:ribosomal protein S18 acetylase RimI-like enzyme
LGTLVKLYFMPLTIRPATNRDLEFLLGLVPRLSEFGLPPSREVKSLETFSYDLLRKALLEPTATTAILIAEADGKKLGFIHLEEEKEFFSGEAQGYIANLAISQEAEGKGVGRALMNAAEAWAKEHGYRYLTLNVFATNRRARTFYEKLGYAEDVLRLTKML